MKLTLSIALVLLSLMASASTHVGNGGNAGDVELFVTLEQLNQATKEMASSAKSARPLCTCTPDFENHRVCDSLHSLNEEQQKFCADSLRTLAPQLSRLSSERGRVEIKWTDDRIILNEDGREFPVDAVAHPTENSLTIRLARFLDLNPHDRLFLLTHEFIHLTDFNGQKITDRGPIGPFTGSQGSRSFVNAMAAAVTVEAASSGMIKRYRRHLSRPRSSSRHWIDASAANGDSQKENARTFSHDDYKGKQFSYRHYRGAIGGVALYRELRAEKKVLSEITARETTQTMGLGASYRFFFFDDPLTYWGQTHLAVDAVFTHTSAKYTASDLYVEIKDSGKAFGGELMARYHFPIFWHLWAHAAIGYAYSPFEYEQINTDSATSLVLTQLGVSYAF